MSTDALDLSYFIVRNNHSASFDIEDSDHVGNLLFMQHLVGTLVKYESAGRYKPSIASEWSVSDDYKVWTFKIRDGLKCEDETTITSNGFRESLVNSLGRYAKKESTPLFQKLVGWKKFVELKSSELEGVKSDGNTLMLSFESPVRSGLLEFLGMPYFGFICPKNLKNEKWIDNRSIISSGSYFLKDFNSNGDIILKKNTNWFVSEKNSPDTVTIKNLQSFSETDLENSKKTIIESLLRVGDPTPHNFTIIKEVPTSFLPIVLLPHKGSFFEDRSTRTYFRNTLISQKQSVEFNSPSYNLGNSFYPIHASNKEYEVNGSDLVLQKTNKPILVRSYPKPLGYNIIYIESLIKKVFEKEGFQVEFDNSSISKVDDWFNKKYDLRILGADIGGGIENWVIEMMFCSNLGVRFPDPQGKICDLVRSYDKGLIDFDSYASNFNNIIYEDAVIVPIMHGGRSWLVSKDIPTDNISPLMGLPNFEDLKIQ